MSSEFNFPGDIGILNNLKLSGTLKKISFLHRANAVRKGMNLTILFHPSAMGKVVEQIRLFSLSMATGLEGKLNSKQLYSA